MEEKNNLIISYINNKVKELEDMSMYIPKENVTKLINLFTNREGDINAIKLKIDTIFNNSVASYKESLEKLGFAYKDIINVYNKIEKMNKTTAKIYLTGGIVPYILLNEESERKHSNLDLLCDKKDIQMLRELFRQKKLYEPKRDSLTYTINNIDYGFQIIIDKIKVNISTFEQKDDYIIEYNFDCHNRIGKIKKINAKISEYIMPYVTSNNKKYITKSLELIAADKLLAKREKDKKDIEKISECNGIGFEEIRKLPLPIVKEEKLIGDNLEFTSTMPRIKLEIPERKKERGFINFGTILLLAAIVAAVILTVK